nr:beta-galactosidase trimerization domain-containing protein [Natronorubrum texcoconense]
MHPDFDYWEHALTYYRALRAHGVTVDVVTSESDLSTYRALVAPTHHLVDDVERLPTRVRLWERESVGG